MVTPGFDAPRRMDIAARVGDPRVPLDPAAVPHLGATLSTSQIARAQDDIDYLGIMGDPEARRDGAIFDAAIGSLGALGYGRLWLAKALGVDERFLRPGRDRVQAHMMHLALAAAIRIGNRWATPGSTGQSAEEIEVVKEQARRLGFRVPAAYGNRYEPEFIDGHVPSGADQPIPAIKIRMLAYFCEHGGSEADLARQFRLSARTIGRARNEDIGLRLVLIANFATVAPGQDDLVAAIYRAANALAVEDPSVVWNRLRAFATERMSRLAAGQADTDHRKDVAA